MSFPRTLDPNRLYMFVFGPGKGESIALRVPPRNWIVIDSCKLMKKAAAKHVLDLYGGVLSCIILTHPHRDHYRYFSQLLTIGDWGYVGCNDHRLDDWSRNPMAARANELEQIVAEIRRRWKSAPDSEWWTWRTTSRLIAGGKLLCLHPAEALARAHLVSPGERAVLGDVVHLERGEAGTGSRRGTSALASDLRTIRRGSDGTARRAEGGASRFRKWRVSRTVDRDRPAILDCHAVQLIAHPKLRGRSRPGRVAPASRRILLDRIARGSQRTGAVALRRQRERNCTRGPCRVVSILRCRRGLVARCFRSRAPVSRIVTRSFRRIKTGNGGSTRSVPGRCGVGKPCRAAFLPGGIAQIIQKTSCSNPSSFCEIPAASGVLSIAADSAGRDNSPTRFGLIDQT